MKHLFHPAQEDIQLSAVLNALSDPIRLRIAKELSINGETACGSMPVPVVKSTLSHHIRTLREAGIVHVRIQGTQHLVTLREQELEQRFPGVMAAILRSMELGKVDSND